MEKVPIVFKRGAKCVENFFGCYGSRQREVSATERFSQTQNIWSNLRLLNSKKGTGSSETDCDFIGDEQDVIRFDEAEKLTKILGGMVPNSRGPLNQWFNDAG